MDELKSQSRPLGGTIEWPLHRSCSVNSVSLSSVIISGRSYFELLLKSICNWFQVLNNCIMLFTTTVGSWYIFSSKFFSFFLVFFYSVTFSCMSTSFSTYTIYTNSPWHHCFCMRDLFGVLVADPVPWKSSSSMSTVSPITSSNS